MQGKQYLGQVDRALEHVAEQSKSIKKAGSLVVDSALRGGHLFVHDPQGIVTYEAWQRSAGLHMVRPLRVGDLPTVSSAGADVVIVFSSSGSASDIDDAFLLELVRRKVTIIGVCSEIAGTSRKNLLRELSAIAIDNGLEGSGGTVSIPYFGEKIGPIDVVVNSVIVFAICAEIIGEFLRRGKIPSVYQSIRTKGGIERNERIWEQYRKQGF